MLLSRNDNDLLQWESDRQCTLKLGEISIAPYGSTYTGAHGVVFLKIVGLW
jgi:hypothetical protein